MPNFASQSIPGYNGVFYVSPDGGNTWTAVGELQDVTLQMKLTMADSSSHDSGRAGWKNQKPTVAEWSATVQQLSIFADAGQAAITAALTPKTRLKGRFDPAGTGTGLPRREGFFYITDWSEKQPNAEMETTSLTLTGDGSLDFSTQ